MYAPAPLRGRGCAPQRPSIARVRTVARSPASTAPLAAASAEAAASSNTAAATSAAAASHSGTLAFQQSPGGAIWTYDFATGATKSLTNGFDPAISPDGAHIVYLSNRTEGNAAGAWRLWVMDADGSNARALPIDVPIDYTFGVEQVVSWGGGKATIED